MATITTLGTSDSGAVSRTTINDNFTNLNTDKAELASPTFTGTPAAPTQAAGDNSTALATTAYVDASNDISCRVYAGGTTSSGGTLTSVIFNTESFDTDGFHDNVTNNTRLTVPAGRAGKYMIGGSVQVANTNEGVITLRLNATTTIAWGVVDGYATSNSGGHVSTVYDLADGDYVELQYQTTQATVAGEGTNFWLYKIN